MKRKIIGFALSAVLFALCFSVEAQQPAGEGSEDRVSDYRLRL